MNYVVMITDAGGYPAAVAAMRGLLDLEPERNYVPTIITYLDEVDQSIAVKIELVDLGFFRQISKEFGGFPEAKTITPEAYARLFINRLLPKSASRCLYVDYDVFFRREVSKLFECDMDGKPIAVVSPPANIKRRSSAANVRLEPRLKQIGFSASDRFFNSGVVLIDLNKFDVEPRMSEIRELINFDGFIGDQEILNYLYKENYSDLSPRWNINPVYFGQDFVEELDPYIFHFTGSQKPWHKTQSELSPYERKAAQLFDRYAIPKPTLRKIVQKRSLAAKLRRSWRKALDAFATGPAKTGSTEIDVDAARATYAERLLAYTKTGLVSETFCDAQI